LFLKFLQLTMVDTTYIMRICNDLQCLQLAYQITCIAGNVLSRTLVGGRSERNEYLLLHAFHDKDFILPEKYNGYKEKNKAIKQQQPTKPSKNSSMASQIKNETTVMDEDMDDDEKMLSMDLNITGRSVLDSTSSGGANSKGAGQSGSTGSNHNGYTGGLVLEPRVGFYDRFILLLDFNSLYPSIIQEYNICFTTIGRPNNELAETNMDEVKIDFSL
jgi:DNA polymerase alpha subunit A